MASTGNSGVRSNGQQPRQAQQRVFSPQELPEELRTEYYQLVPVYRWGSNERPAVAYYQLQPSGIGQGSGLNYTMALSGTTSVATSPITSAGGLSTMQNLGSGTVTSVTQADLPESVDSAEKFVYVNPKQFHRMVKRRLARAELQKKHFIPQKRSRYLHESRHRHAMKRGRAKNGQFFSKDNQNQSNGETRNEEDGEENDTQN